MRINDKDTSWLERLRRAQHDRRVQVGMWARYQDRRGKEINFAVDFGYDWVFLNHGYMRFPEHMNLTQNELLEIGERRALNCKHPAHKHSPECRVIRLADADITWNGWQVFKRVDLECGYVSYVTYFRESVCGEHLIKVELDLDKFNYDGDPMTLPDYAEPLKEAIQ